MEIRQHFKNNIRNKFIRNFEIGKSMVCIYTASYGNFILSFKLKGQEELKNNLISLIKGAPSPYVKVRCS